MKNRLTKLVKEAIDYAKEESRDEGGVFSYEDVAEKLLESNLIVPPCEMDTVLYYVGSEYFWRAVIVGYFCTLSKYGKFEPTVLYELKGNVGKIEAAPVSDIGKTLFFTEEEALYALKNRRSVSLVDGHIEE